MAVPTIALYASPPSSVCSTSYTCQTNAHATYEFELNPRSSSTASSSASSSHKPIVGGLSRLFSSLAVKDASFSSDREELGGDELKELSGSFCYTPSKYLAGSSIKRDQSPVSVLQGQVSCSSSPPMRIARERSGCDVGFQTSIHVSFHGGANGLFNGFVRNALGSCVDYDSPSFEVHNNGIDVGFIFCGCTKFFVIKAFYEAEKAHRGQMLASGDPYLQHCVETAVLLAIIGANSTVVPAGLYMTL
ncbi:unnamed protein product [Dovyalis caffra]|uniref:Uncharacterized protein n=1 Tax=Dovyalis caffra TaxID=77055 RepID=A0AAV1SCR8_9ROSI|nr:unnamed protein product [Dovyalis caffra]